ncbi:MAG: hypothetical protein C4289_07945 [Chloroflexota bacterium]
MLLLQTSAVIGVGTLAACRLVGSPAASGDGQPVKALTAPATLEAWSPWEGTEGLERRFAAFQQVEPLITIQWTGLGFGAYLDKITATVAGGTPPDLVYLDNQHQGFFGKNDLLVDQGPLGKRDRDFRVDLIEPRALDLYTYEGKVLGYPWMLTTGQVFFNRAICAASGHP